MGIPHSDGGHQDGDRRNGVGAGWRGDSGVEEARWINSGGGVTVWRREERRLSGGTGAEPGTINYHTNQISYFSGKLKKYKTIAIVLSVKEQGSVVGRAQNMA